MVSEWDAGRMRFRNTAVRNPLAQRVALALLYKDEMARVIDTGDWHGRWMGRRWNLLGNWGMFQIDVLSPWDERDVLCGIWMGLPDPQHAVSLDPEHLEKTRIWLFVIAIVSSILTDMKEFRINARSCLVVLPEVVHNKVHCKTMLMAWRSALSTRWRSLLLSIRAILSCQWQRIMKHQVWKSPPPFPSKQRWLRQVIVRSRDEDQYGPNTVEQQRMSNCGLRDLEWWCVVNIGKNTTWKNDGSLELTSWKRLKDPGIVIPWHTVKDWIMTEYDPEAKDTRREWHDIGSEEDWTSSNIIGRCLCLIWRMNTSRRRLQQWGSHRTWRRRRTSSSVGVDMSGTPCGELNDDNKIPGQSADLEQVIHQREGNANCRGLKRVTHCAWFSESACTLQLQVRWGNSTGRAPFWSLCSCKKEWRGVRTDWRVDFF